MLGPQSRTTSTISLTRSSPAFSESQSSVQSTVLPDTLKSKVATPSIASQRSNTTPDTGTTSGFRAAEAYVRPSPIATVGNVTSFGFDLRNATFTLSLECKEAATEEVPTEIFLPEFHFPRDQTAVEVSSGKWSISIDDMDGGLIQRLRWIHGAGKQSIKVKGVQRRQGMALGKAEEEGYLEQCKQTRCCIM